MLCSENTRLPPKHVSPCRDSKEKVLVGARWQFRLLYHLQAVPSPSSLHPWAHQRNSPTHQPRKHNIICQHTNTHNKQIKCQKILSWLELTLETWELPVRNARQHPTLPSHCSREGTDSKLKSFHDNWPLWDRRLWKWFSYVSHNLLTKYPSSATFDVATPNNPRYLLSQKS